MKLSKKQIARISKILEDLGKLMFAIGVIAPAVSQEDISFSRVIISFAVGLISLLAALQLEKGDE